MKTVPKMKKIITAIAQKHSLDLSAKEAHLHLDMPHYDPLVIEKVGKNLLSVTHYFRQNGDLVPDPDIVFFVGYEQGWLPAEITMAIGTRTVCAKFSDDGTSVIGINHKAMDDIADFAEMWAKNITHQNWLEAGVRT